MAGISVVTSNLKGGAASATNQSPQQKPAFVSDPLQREYWSKNIVPLLTAIYAARSINVGNSTQATFESFVKNTKGDFFKDSVGSEILRWAANVIKTAGSVDLVSSFVAKRLPPTKQVAVSEFSSLDSLATLISGQYEQNQIDIPALVGSARAMAKIIWGPDPVKDREPVPQDMEVPIRIHFSSSPTKNGTAFSVALEVIGK